MIQVCTCENKQEIEPLFCRVFEDTFHKKAPNFATATEGEVIYTAVLDGRVVGLMTVWEATSFIHFVLVDPAYQRRGVGTALLEKAAQTYKRSLSLKCLKTNENAMSFYLSHGWQVKETGQSEDGDYDLLEYSVSGAAQYMTTENKLRVLTRIAETLNGHGITWGVGASLLLYFKGIVREFHDIDLMTTAEDVEQVKELLSGMGELQPPNPNDRYFSRHFYEFVIDGVDVDVMEGFVIVHDGQKIDCSFSADSIAETIEWNGKKIPLQAVSDWRRYYALMGREAKVNRIDQALDRKEV